MSFCTLNTLRVLRGSLTLPRVGRWHADLVVDSPVPLAGPVALAFGDGALLFRGAIHRGDVFQDTFHCRIVGGANALAHEIPAKYYRGVPLRLPLADLLREVGETLAATSDEAVLSRLLVKWTRRAGPAAHALAELVDVGEAAWRVLPNGSVWVGRETWPTLETPHQLLKDDRADGRIEIASDLPLLRPGVVFGQRHIAAVVHTFGPDKVRSEAWVSREPSIDRFKSSFTSLVRATMREVDHHKPYAARVVLQDADGTLQLRPDDERLPGLTGVPIRYGVPGVTAKVPPGARCVVEFEQGDPRTPIVTGFEPGAILELSFDGGSQSVARVGDSADCGTLTLALADTVPPGPGKVLAVTYTPPVGPPESAIFTFASKVEGPPLTTFTLRARIDKGAPRVKA